MKIEDAKQAIERISLVRQGCAPWIKGAYDMAIVALEKQLNIDLVEVVRCKDCRWHEDCICVVCEDGDTVVCGKDHKHVTKNHYCSSSTR